MQLYRYYAVKYLACRAAKAKGLTGSGRLRSRSVIVKAKIEDCKQHREGTRIDRKHHNLSTGLSYSPANPHSVDGLSTYRFDHPFILQRERAFYIREVHSVGSETVQTIGIGSTRTRTVPAIATPSMLDIPSRCCVDRFYSFTLSTLPSPYICEPGKLNFCLDPALVFGIDMYV